MRPSLIFLGALIGLAVAVIFFWAARTMAPRNYISSVLGIVIGGGIGAVLPTIIRWVRFR